MSFLENNWIALLSLLIAVPGAILGTIAYFKSRPKIDIKFGDPGIIHTILPNGHIKKRDNICLVPMDIINSGGTDITITNFTFHFKNNDRHIALLPNEKDFFHHAIKPHSKKTIHLPVEFFTDVMILTNEFTQPKNIKIHLTDAENNNWDVRTKEIKKLKLKL